MRLRTAAECLVAHRHTQKDQCVSCRVRSGKTPVEVISFPKRCCGRPVEWVLRVPYCQVSGERVVSHACK